MTDSFILGDSILAGQSGDLRTDTDVGYNAGDMIRVANMIYGEVPREDFMTMQMVGSTALNRADNFSKDPNFGDGTIAGAISAPNAYYAVQNNNEAYREATTQRFASKENEKRYKRALQIASGLIRGTIPRHAAEFFMTGKEVGGQKRKKKGGIDFTAFNETGKVGKYKTFAYK